MIPPTLMAELSAEAKAIGEENLDRLITRDTHWHEDLALITYMYHKYTAAALRSTVASVEQIAEIISLIETVSAFARTEAENQLRAIGQLRESDS